MGNETQAELYVIARWIQSAVKHADLQTEGSHHMPCVHQSHLTGSFAVAS